MPRSIKIHKINYLQPLVVAFGILLAQGVNGQYTIGVKQLLNTLHCSAFAVSLCDTINEPVCCNGTWTKQNTCLATHQAPCFQAHECVSGECVLDASSNTQAPPAPSCDRGGIGIVCTDVEKPVCCNGVTFKNICVATSECHDENKCTQGGCPLVSIFSNSNMPAQVFNIQTDSQLSKGFFSTGASNDDSACICSTNENSVCCAGKTYKNSCRATCAGVFLNTCTARACELQCDECIGQINATCCQEAMVDDSEPGIWTDFDSPCHASCAGTTKQCLPGTCADNGKQQVPSFSFGGQGIRGAIDSISTGGVVESSSVGNDTANDNSAQDRAACRKQCKLQRSLNVDEFLCCQGEEFLNACYADCQYGDHTLYCTSGRCRLK